MSKDINDIDAIANAIDNISESIIDISDDIDKIQKMTDDIIKQFRINHQGSASPWEKWFAWHPVTIKGKKHWLKNVYRRNTIDSSLNIEWEYGDLFDVIKETK